MKTILYLCTALFLNAATFAQTPTFKLSSQHLQFPVNSLAGKNDLIYFNLGDSLKIGDVSNPDTLIVVNSILLETPVNTMEINGDRLYAAGSQFFIFNISAPDQPLLISSTNLPESVNSIAESNGYYYLGFKSSIGILNISNENNPVLDLKSDLKDFYFLKTGSNKLIAKKTDYLHIFKIETPDNPVKIDSIKQEWRSDENFAIYKNNLIVGKFYENAEVYDISDNNKVTVIDTLENVECSQFFIDSDYLIGIERGFIVGTGLILYNLSHWPDLEPESYIYSDELPNSIYRDSVKILYSSNYGGLICNIRNGDSWDNKYNLFEQFYMFNPCLKDNILTIPEFDGYQIFRINIPDLPELIAQYHYPPTDVLNETYTQIEKSGDNIFINGGDRLFAYKYPNMENKNSIAHGWYRFSNFQLTGSLLWANDEINDHLLAFDINSNSDNKLLYLFSSGSQINDFIFKGNQLFVSTRDSGIVIYNQDPEKLYSFVKKESLSIDGNADNLIIKDSLLICKYFDSNYKTKSVVFTLLNDGLYHKLTLASIPDFFDHGTPHLFQNKYLFASGNKEFLIYDMSNTENPILVKSLPSPGKSKPSGVYADGDKVVLTSNYGGFSIYDFTGFTDNVDEQSTTSTTQFILSQNYPNPFNPSTTLSFTVPNAGLVELEVFNLLGQKLETVHSGFLKSGRHIFQFEGSRFPSGIYFAKLKSGSGEKTIKMTLMK